MRTGDRGFDKAGLRSAAMPSHQSGLWHAMVSAALDGDEDPTIARRRLAALRLRPTYATLADYGRRVG